MKSGHKAQVSIIRGLIIGAIALAIIFVAFFLFSDRVRGEIPGLSDPIFSQAQKNDIIMQCSKACVNQDVYTCDAEYTIDIDGILITDTCADFYSSEPSSSGGSSQSRESVSLSTNDEFKPCNTMTITVRDTKIREISDMRIKLAKSGESTNTVKLSDVSGRELTKSSTYAATKLYDLCNEKCTQIGEKPIEIKFNIPCTNGDSRSISPDEEYNFTIESTQLGFKKTYLRTFTCTDMVEFPDGLNVGSKTHVAFKKEIKKDGADSMSIDAKVRPGCFSGKIYSTDCSEIKVSSTGKEDKNGKLVYEFDMPQIKDTEVAMDKYDEQTRVIFRIFVQGSSKQVNVCNALQSIEWHCPEYSCYLDSGDSTEKVLTLPQSSDGKGQILPACIYLNELICDEGCYPIGSKNIIDTIDSAGECNPPNSWRYSCYDNEFEKNNNPTRCRIANLELADKVQVCKKKGSNYDCYHVPFENKDEEANILTYEDLSTYERLITNVNISNTGTIPVHIKKENIDITFDEKESIGGYFSKIYKPAGLQNIDGTEEMTLKPGETITLESHFTIPSRLSTPRYYTISVEIDNIDFDAIPTSEDRTNDNKISKIIRANYECCKNCASCDTDKCKTCGSICSNKLNSDGHYECRPM